MAQEIICTGTATDLLDKIWFGEGISHNGKPLTQEVTSVLTSQANMGRENHVFTVAIDDGFLMIW